MNRIEKMYRFFWRTAINIICISPVSRNWLYPRDKLSNSFGRGDVEYAWRVFLGHYRRLHNHGFDKAQHILEIGPGRNLGTALLWWCFLTSRSEVPVRVVCWDVYKNAEPEASEFWQMMAHGLIKRSPDDSADTVAYKVMVPLLKNLLELVAKGERKPDIVYRVISLDELTSTFGEKFDLVYSQAAIEHVWFIETFWELIGMLTVTGGWHSHRIDLADHGRRETNYIEMLQWSKWMYWLTQRFVPGAINRWRAQDHVHEIESLGFRILHQGRDLRDALPVDRDRLALPYRNYDEAELRCTGLNLVARN